MTNKISNQPLKGMQDDFPSNFKIINWIQNKIKKIAFNFGYYEYDSPVLEPIELYLSKTSEELIKKQSYNFKDRGEREILLRPEITPSMARMISKIYKEATKPFRWFSMPKCYRYERPQKGRLREFRQINFDLVGINNIYSDIEIIQIIDSLFKEFKIPNDKIEIRINHRKILDTILSNNKFTSEESKIFYNIVDKYDKLKEDDKLSIVENNFTDTEKKKIITRYLSLKTSDELKKLLGDTDDESILDFFNIFDILKDMNITNVIFSPKTVRGLDYYSGLVFEVFGLSGDFNRALFGGGRYDNLIGYFSDGNLSGIGFGMGLYIFTLFLETNNFIPKEIYENTKSGYYIILLDKKAFNYSIKIASILRSNNNQVEIGIDFIKFNKSFLKAEKLGYSKVIIIGEDELKNNIINIKDLKTGEKKSISTNEIPDLYNE